jgi:hypothetical protein
MTSYERVVVVCYGYLGLLRFRVRGLVHVVLELALSFALDIGREVVHRGLGRKGGILFVALQFVAGR